jgi:hypothetical protein
MGVLLLLSTYGAIFWNPELIYLHESSRFWWLFLPFSKVASCIATGLRSRASVNRLLPQPASSLFAFEGQTPPPHVVYLIGVNVAAFLYACGLLRLPRMLDDGTGAGAGQSQPGPTISPGAASPGDDSDGEREHTYNSVSAFFSPRRGPKKAMNSPRDEDGWLVSRDSLLGEVLGSFWVSGCLRAGRPFCRELWECATGICGMQIIIGRQEFIIGFFASFGTQPERLELGI